MKKSKAQKKADAEFIKKIGSLTYGFGAKDGPKPKVEMMDHSHLPTIKMTCDDCGTSTTIKPAFAAKVTIPLPERKPSQEEQSFAA